MILSLSLLLCLQQNAFVGGTEFESLPPGFDGPEPFDKALGLDINADYVRDIVTLKNNSAFLFWNAGPCDSISLIASGVNDIAVLPPGPWSQEEQLLTVGSGAPRVYSQEKYTSGFSSMTVGGVNYHGAQRVTVGDVIDGDGQADIVAVLADGVTIRTRGYNTATSTWQNGPVLTAPYPVASIATMQFDDPGEDPAAEIVIDTSEGLYVLSHSGGVRRFVRALDPTPGSIAILPAEGGGGRDRGLWATRGALDGDFDLIVEFGEDPISVLFPPTQMDVVGFSNGKDMDGDGDLDVSFSSNDEHRVYVLRNQRLNPDPGFAGSGLFSFLSEIGSGGVGDDDGPASTEAGTYAVYQPAGTDVPGDFTANPVLEELFWEEQNLIVPVNEVLGLRLVREEVLPLLPETQGLPLGIYKGFADDHLYFCPGAEESDLQVALMSEGLVTLSTTDIEVVVWWQPDGSNVEPDAVSTCVLPVSLTDPNADAYYNDLEERVYVRITVPGGNGFPGRFHIVCRPVHIASAQYVAGPMTIGILAGTGEFGTGELSEDWTWTNPSTCPGYSAGFPGAFAQADYVPVFIHGQPPALSFVCENY